MKQGRASRDVSESHKVEPSPRGVSPGGADQQGQKVGVRRAVETLFEGHGYKAPGPSGTTVHKCGSQGRHK